MSGWLDLTQLGLAPDQKHQAFLAHRRLSTVGLPRLHAALVGAYLPKLAIWRDWQILGRFSQLREEIEHFCGCGQEEVAKIVHCGEQFYPNQFEAKATLAGGLKFCDVI